MEEHIQNQQDRQQWRHDKSRAKLRELLPRVGECAKYPRRNGEVGSRYSERLEPMTYLVRVGRQLRYVHIDHLLQTERVNWEEVFEEVVP